MFYHKFKVFNLSDEAQIAAILSLPQDKLLLSTNIKAGKEDKENRKVDGVMVTKNNQLKIMRLLDSFYPISLEFLTQQIAVKRTVRYYTYSNLYPALKQKEYSQTQSILGHLFALRCWHVIEYLIRNHFF